MSETASDADQTELGPVDFLVIEFPRSGVTGEGLPLLLDLVDRGVIRILDLVFVTRTDDGAVQALELKDIDGDGDLDLAVFEGASSGLLGEDDLREAGNAVELGRSACVVVYENLWAAPLAAALRRGGAQMVASGRIPLPELLTAVGSESSSGH